MQCTSSRKKQLLDLMMFKQATSSKQSHTSLLLVNLKINIYPKIEEIISRLFHSQNASFFCQHLPNLIRQVKYILGRKQMCKNPNPKRIFSMCTWKFHKASVKFKWQIKKLLKFLSFTFQGRVESLKSIINSELFIKKTPLSLLSPSLSRLFHSFLLILFFIPDTFIQSPRERNISERNSVLFLEE